MSATTNHRCYDDLPTVDEQSGDYLVVIETPKGHRNKYNYDRKRGLFVLGGVLTSGMVFPYDFGFLPGTLGGDGDPLDVLVLMDEPAFTGCVVAVRVIAVIEAEQTERDGETSRNDRLIAVSTESHEYTDVKYLNDLNDSLVGEIEYFFESYNRIKGKEFKPIGRHGAQVAQKVVEQGMKAFAHKQTK